MCACICALTSIEKSLASQLDKKPYTKAWTSSAFKDGKRIKTPYRDYQSPLSSPSHSSASECNQGSVTKLIVRSKKTTIHRFCIIVMRYNTRFSYELIDVEILLHASRPAQTLPLREFNRSCGLSTHQCWVSVLSQAWLRLHLQLVVHNANLGRFGLSRLMDALVEVFF